MRIPNAGMRFDFTRQGFLIISHTRGQNHGSASGKTGGRINMFRRVQIFRG